METLRPALEAFKKRHDGKPVTVVVDGVQDVLDGEEALLLAEFAHYRRLGLLRIILISSKPVSGRVYNLGPTFEACRQVAVPVPTDETMASFLVRQWAAKEGRGEETATKADASLVSRARHVVNALGPRLDALIETAKWPPSDADAMVTSTLCAAGFRISTFYTNQELRPHVREVLGGTLKAYEQGRPYEFPFGVLGFVGRAEHSAAEELADAGLLFLKCAGRNCIAFPRHRTAAAAMREMIANHVTHTPSMTASHHPSWPIFAEQQGVEHASWACVQNQRLFAIRPSAMLVLTRCALVLAVLAATSAAAVPGTAPWRDIVVVDCKGGVHGFALNNIARFGARLGNDILGRAYRMFQEEVLSQARCRCPNMPLPLLERSVNLTFANVLATIGDTSRNAVNYTAYNCSLTFDIQSLARDVAMWLPSTCTAAAYDSTGQCATTFGLPDFGVSLRLVVAKCPDPARLLPFVSLSCVGTLCEDFLRPCATNADCNRNFRCRGFTENPEDISDELSDLLNDTNIVSPSDSSGFCPANASGNNTGRYAATQLLRFATDLFGAGTPTSQLKFCGIDTLLSNEDEGSDEGLTGNFGDRLGRAFSVACKKNRMLRDYIHTPVRNYTIDYRYREAGEEYQEHRVVRVGGGCRNLGPWDGVLPNGENAASAARKMGESFGNVDVAGETDPASYWDVLHLTCDSRVAVNPGEPLSLQVYLPRVHAFLSHVWSQIVGPLARCRHANRQNDAQFRASYALFEPALWLRLLGGQDFNDNATLPTLLSFLTKEFKIDANFTHPSIPSSCNVADYLSTGVCEAKFTGFWSSANPLFTDRLNFTLKLTRCGTAPYALPDIRLSCHGANCSKIFRIYDTPTCSQDADCESGQCERIFGEHPGFFGSILTDRNFKQDYSVATVEMSKYNGILSFPASAIVLGWNTFFALNPSVGNITVGDLQEVSLNSRFNDYQVFRVNISPSRTQAALSYYSFSVSHNFPPLVSSFPVYIRPLFTRSCDGMIRPYNSYSPSPPCETPCETDDTFNRWFIRTVKYAIFGNDTWRTVNATSVCMPQIVKDIGDRAKNFSLSTTKFTSGGKKFVSVEGLVAFAPSPCSCGTGGVCIGDATPRCVCLNYYDRATNCTSCLPGYSLTSNCTECAAGRGGANCLACPQFESAPCGGSARGTCDEGRLGTGTCVCKAGFGGPDCSLDISSRPRPAALSEILTVDCGGGVHLLPSLGVVRSDLFLALAPRVLEWLNNMIKVKTLGHAQKCGDNATTTYVEENFVLRLEHVIRALERSTSIVDRCNGDDGPAYNASCNWKFRWSDVSFSRLKFMLPSTCSAAAYAAGQPCFVKLPIAALQITLQLALRRCGASDWPFVSLTCEGDGCGDFFRPCVDNSNCNKNFQCRSPVNQVDYYSSALLRYSNGSFSSETVQRVGVCVGNALREFCPGTQELCLANVTMPCYNISTQAECQSSPPRMCHYDSDCSAPSASVARDRCVDLGLGENTPYAGDVAYRLRKLLRELELYSEADAAQCPAFALRRREGLHAGTESLRRLFLLYQALYGSGSVSELSAKNVQMCGLEGVLEGRNIDAIDDAFSAIGHALCRSDGEVVCPSQFGNFSRGLTLCDGLAPWDGVMTSGARADDESRMNGTAFRAPLQTPTYASSVDYVHLATLSCDSQLSLLGSTPFAQRANLPPVHQVLNAVGQRILRELARCRTGDSQSEAQFEGSFVPTSPGFWMSVFSTDARVPFGDGTAIKTLLDKVLEGMDRNVSSDEVLQLPSSCTRAGYLSTGLCEIAYDGLRSLFGNQMTLVLRLTRCGVNKWALPEISLECFGDGCRDVFHVWAAQPCMQNADCAPERECFDLGEIPPLVQQMFWRNSTFPDPDDNGDIMRADLFFLIKTLAGLDASPWHPLNATRTTTHFCEPTLLATLRDDTHVENWAKNVSSLNNITQVRTIHGLRALTQCNCNGNGVCTYPQGLDNPQCACNGNWGGPNCNVCDRSQFWGPGCLPCPRTAAGVCSGHGSCVQATGLCMCSSGFQGPLCNDSAVRCGDGVKSSGEQCDTLTPSDPGCVNCVVQPNYTCVVLVDSQGRPYSECQRSVIVAADGSTSVAMTVPASDTPVTFALPPLGARSGAPESPRSFEVQIPPALVPTGTQLVVAPVAPELIDESLVVGNFRFQGTQFRIEAQTGGAALNFDDGPVVFSIGVDFTNAEARNCDNAVAGETNILAVYRNGSWVNSADSCPPQFFQQSISTDCVLTVAVCHFSNFAALFKPAEDDESESFIESTTFKIIVAAVAVLTVALIVALCVVRCRRRHTSDEGRAIQLAPSNQHMTTSTA